MNNEVFIEITSTDNTVDNTIDNTVDNTIDNKSLNENKDSCSICLESNNQMEKTICNHLFHKECLDPWLATHNTCPICRKELYIVVNPQIILDRKRFKASILFTSVLYFYLLILILFLFKKII